VSGKIRRFSLHTDVAAIAKEKLRAFEQSLASGKGVLLPTRTAISEVLSGYIEHIRTYKTTSSLKNDLWYLREIFGPVCASLRYPSRGRQASLVRVTLSAPHFEAITTADISDFLTRLLRSRSLAPKTVNRYREVLHRVFNWAVEQRGLRLQQERNPVGKVHRYRERAKQIRFLTLAQIEEQLRALAGKSQLQTMVATYIYAGLRREELLWLTREDVDFTYGRYGVIHIRAKKVLGEFWEPKTKVNRVVPISSSLRPFLDVYESPVVLGRWFFPSPWGKRWHPDNFSWCLREANERAGLAWNCLDFRHTFGSQLATKGESLYKSSALMGNSPEIYRRHYAALLPESLYQSVEFLPVTLQVLSEDSTG